MEKKTTTELDTRMDKIIKLDQRFGRIGIKNKLLTVEQVKDALKKQEYIYQKSNYIMLIGDILVYSGVLHERYRDAILKRQNRLGNKDDRRKSFGYIAIEKGYINPDQLESALSFQSQIYNETKKVKFLGDILVERKDITEVQRDDVAETRNRYRSEKPQPADVKPEEKEPCQIQPDEEEQKEEVTSETKIFPKEEVLPEKEEPDEDESGELQTDLNLKENLEISISKDGLEAFLKVKAMLPVRTQLIDLKHYIKKNGVIHGLTENQTLKNWINNKNKRRRPLKIAQGTPPTPPKNARIVFHFDTNARKSGTEKKDGSIDFKNRGETISIKKGTLLAEKIPPEEGIPGVDVTGKMINVERPKDLNLKVGKGAIRSPDNLKILATVNGMPEIDKKGKISVHQVLVINSDIGMQTGHIFFDGVVVVRGEITPGFQVKAERLEARAIMNADVDVKGDIVVNGGIVGARVKAKGNVSAKFLKAAKIMSKGDVVIQKEIVDSVIDTTSKCLCERGKIVASQIYSTHGIRAIEIGSDYSASCKIMVGIHPKTLKKLDHLRNTLKHCSKDEQIDIKAEINRITSRELSGAPDLTADIIASKNIIGAEIQTRGKIVTYGVKNAVIEALGHVVVQKEIIKSRIHSGGEIHVQNGNVLMSNLTALNGIKALEVGSEMSSPCRLCFGVNETVKERLETYQQTLESKQSLLEQSESLYERYQRQFKTFEKNNAQDISWIKPFTKGLSDAMRKKFDAIDQVPPQVRMIKIKEYMDSMDAKMTAADYTKEFRSLRNIQEYMEKYFGKHQKMMDQITTLENRIKDLKVDIKTLISDIRDISTTAIINPNAFVQILKRLYSRTELHSINGITTITQDFGPCKIAEQAKIGESSSKICIKQTGTLQAKPSQSQSTNAVSMTQKTKKTKKTNGKDSNTTKIVIRGRVVSSTDGLSATGVPNVKIIVKGWKEQKEAMSNQNGEFVMIVYKPGKYTMSIISRNRPPMVRILKLNDCKQKHLGDLMLN